MLAILGVQGLKSFLDSYVDCLSADGVSNYCSAVFEAMRCYYYTTDFVRKPARLQMMSKLREELRRDSETRYVGITYDKKDTKSLRFLSVSSGVPLKTDASVETNLPENFPYKRPLSEERPVQEFIFGKLFGYAQCDIEVSQLLRRYFSNFHLIFENTVASTKNNGTSMKEYGERENITDQPGRLLLSSFPMERSSPLYFGLLGAWAGVPEISSVR